VVSPQLSILGQVHIGAQRTTEFVAEEFHVGQRADDPETVWRMVVCHSILLTFKRILGAPNIGVAQLENLLWCSTPGARAAVVRRRVL